MKIHGKIRFKDAIVVDEKLLRELEEIILSFYTHISFSCDLCNDDTISFGSLEELLNYDNAKIRKIVSLTMSFSSCGAYNKIQFDPDISLFSSYKYTVQGTFETEDMDKSILFSEKIKNSLNKHKQSIWYTLITKMCMMHFLILLLLFSFGSTFYLVFTKGINISKEMGYSPITINLGIAFMFFCMLFGYVFSKCRNTLLPPIAYKIGEQIKEIEKGRDLFSKIFWGVIITFAISVLVGKLF